MTVYGNCLRELNKVLEKEEWEEEEKKKRKLEELEEKLEKETLIKICMDLFIEFLSITNQVWYS